MKLIWTVFWYELRRNAQRKGYLFATFGIPLLLLLAVLILPPLLAPTPEQAQDQAAQLRRQLELNRDQRVGYVDLSGTLGDVGSLASVLTAYPDEAAARSALEAGTISQYYVVAPDYLETGAVTQTLPELNTALINNALLRSLLRIGLAQGVEPQVAARLVQPAIYREVNLAVQVSPAADGDGLGAIFSEGRTFALIYAFALTLLMSLFVTNGYLMQSVIEEKESRLIEILIASVRPSGLLAGKILALGLLGLLQFTAWVLGMILIVRLTAGSDLLNAVEFIRVISGIEVPVDKLPLLFLYFVLAYLLYAALYAGVGALSSSLREGPQYAAIFTIPAAVPLYFLPIFAEAPDGALPTALSLFPLSAPIAMTQRLLISNVPAWQVVVSLALLMLTCVGAIWLVGRLFRVQALLAGHFPKLREIPRLLRG